MSEVRIIAVSLLGGTQVEHITHVWTAGGAVPVRHAVDDLWRRRCRYYTMATSGRVDVCAMPARGPGPLQRLMGRTLAGHLVSQPNGRATDALLNLPTLPSPNRGRRSQQHGAAGRSRFD